MAEPLSLRGLRLWKVSLDRVGPFQESVEQVTFASGSGTPANMFVLAAGNGRGKTTILDAVSTLFGFLAGGPDGAALEFLSDPATRVQLDIVVTLGPLPVMLSISWGDVGEGGMSGWTDSPLENVQADRWLRLGYQRSALTGEVERAAVPLPGDSDKDGWEVRGDAVEALDGLLRHVRSARESKWPGYNEGLVSAPTLLHFAASRDIVHTEAGSSLARPTVPRYAASHRFDREGAEWLSSLANLLVWYFWVSPVDFAAAVKFVNEVAFGRENPDKYLQAEPNRDPPDIMVSNKGGHHRVDRLSSGERNLVQFALRYGAHRTANTIVLIDEVELHLHPAFQKRLVALLKQRVLLDGSVVVCTTHSERVVQEFAFEEDEVGIEKGGELLLG